jgi:hypothetical protein
MFHTAGGICHEELEELKGGNCLDILKNPDIMVMRPGALPDTFSLRECLIPLSELFQIELDELTTELEAALSSNTKNPEVAQLKTELRADIAYLKRSIAQLCDAKQEYEMKKRMRIV